jgi:hypothetical protein
MPQPPLAVTLTDWQKIEALKRARERYQEDLTKVESELTDILTACAEADFIAQYLGDQPEVKEMRAKKPEAEGKEKRRQYLIALIERLDAVIPKQAEVKAPVPGSGGKAPAGLKRF